MAVHVTSTRRFLMVTTIGIDPHKATHTAVAIDEAEMVLGEITIAADRYQTKRLVDWAGGRQMVRAAVWAVEAAGGLGYLFSQQLVARGERVVDVPAVLASRVRVLSSGKSEKNDPNDARSVAIAALRQPGLGVVHREDYVQVLRMLAKRHRELTCATNPGGVSAPCRTRPAQAWWAQPAPISQGG